MTGIVSSGNGRGQMSSVRVGDWAKSALPALALGNRVSVMPVLPGRVKQFTLCNWADTNIWPCPVSTASNKQKHHATFLVEMFCLILTPVATIFLWPVKTGMLRFDAVWFLWVQTIIADGMEPFTVVCGVVGSKACRFWAIPLGAFSLQ
jgi:hypothetical protein